MSSSRKRPLESPDNSQAPKTKKQKPNLAKMWTRTNPDSGQEKNPEKPRLYRKTTIQILKKHQQRRKDQKNKKKKTKKKKSTKKKKKVSKKEDEEDYSRFTRRYEGHVVVVTGGGEALGQAIAVRMAQEGAYVYVIDHYKYKDTIDLCEQFGRSPNTEDDDEDIDDYQGFKCDVSDFKAVQTIINQIIEERGYIDVLINAAFQHKGDGKIVEDVKLSDLNSVMKVNFFGTFNTCKLVLPLMAKVNYGRVVNIVSHAGKNPRCGQFIEASASSAIIAGTKSMADDYARVNVTCNVVTASYFEHDSWKLDKNDVKELIPVGRNGELAEIAATVAFVASEENSYSTGAVFNCTGGVLLSSN